ncbi:MAG: hypothetical protein FWC32_01485, partial [Firmicutes bacterium]|nr:hypothetical protein [Bacillota bacterium]
MYKEISDRKLEYFENTIMQDVERERAKARNQASRHLNRVASEAIETATRRNKVIIQTKHEEIRRNANSQITRAKVKAIAKYVEIRKQQIDRLFEEIENSLAKFTQEPGYENYLVHRIKQVQHFGDFAIVKLLPHDTRFKEAIAAATKLAPETGSQDYIGG